MKPKHPKKLRITEKDFLLANRRAAREEDIDMTKKQKERISRIEAMEARYQKVKRVLGELENNLSILRDYMESGQWQKDFEADEAGLVPRDLPREVLSEDALYNLLADADEVRAVNDDNSLDWQSKKKAYDLFDSGLMNSLEPGTIQCLQQIHAYIFGGLYDFAGQIRTKNISKGGFTFANALHFPTILTTIEKMPETTFDEIADKYVEMNVAHPFMEGNGRSTRIWLDLMLKHSLKKCVDWSQIDKNSYLDAMRRSVVDAAPIKALLGGALTEKIDDRETFMKGIDYSYYYEES